jgi:hypothetical protein
LVLTQPCEILKSHIFEHLIYHLRFGAPEGGVFRGARIRPISVIEQGPAGNRWHAIPNTTQDTLSVMIGIGLGVALVGSLIILLARLGRK